MYTMVSIERFILIALAIATQAKPLTCPINVKVLILLSFCMVPIIGVEPMTF